MASFHYPLLCMPNELRGLNDVAIYAQLCPDDAAWLQEHAEVFQVNCYFWPELFGLMAHDIGRTPCAITVNVPDELTEDFLEVFKVGTAVRGVQNR